MFILKLNTVHKCIITTPKYNRSVKVIFPDCKIVGGKHEQDKSVTHCLFLMFVCLFVCLFVLPLVLMSGLSLVDNDLN